MADYGWKNTILPQAGAAQVSKNIALNPWARASDADSRNLHRTDLWYIDFSSVISQIGFALGDTGEVGAFYCKSVSLPETRVKAEVFRRDGIPFNMPGADEPLDAMSVVFWMESVNPNPVVQLLTDWMRLVRAGRGERYSDGYDSTIATEVTLNSDYTIEISYTFKLWLLQGALGQVPAVLPANPSGINASYCQLERVTGFDVKAWLGSFKIADLNYEGSQIVTIDAKFYPEYIVQSQ